MVKKVVQCRSLRVHPKAPQLILWDTPKPSTYSFKALMMTGF